MEDSESEAIFDTLNLNPQLFINETLNTVDDLLNDAFDFYLQEASKLLKVEVTGCSQELTKDELLASSSTIQDALSDPDVDAELDSLRNKLTLVGAETDKINSELKELERQSASSGHCAGLINEALQLYEDTSVQDMFQEMMQTATELRVKMKKLKTRQAGKMEHERAERIHNSLTNYFTVNPKKAGLSNAKLDDLHEFLAELKKM
ncbi:hypothetical protein ES288_A11G041900v1 [Gossypium darwinii]|uniref:Uncharacterized protein n=1 Tax=Gossypium darwinii TaxID=34276 RepID=A0A5D2EFX8_GOSDA|nr:hypothetical protein ES288_A11G041900v1 [Gossypium darwinii]